VGAEARIVGRDAERRKILMSLAFLLRRKGCDLSPPSKGRALVDDNGIGRIKRNGPPRRQQIPDDQSERSGVMVGLHHLFFLEARVVGRNASAEQ